MTTFASIWFDCDSTLAEIEGIDELARLAGADVERDVARMTDEAMQGGVPVAEVYGRRLEIIRPNAGWLDEVAAAYVARAVPNARDTVRALDWLGKRTGIISGGLTPAVVALADHLGIPRDRVHAVDVTFEEDGSYAGFDAASPLARNGGKPEILAALDAAERPVAFVGDGVTDLEAAPVVDRFIGFGGVAIRDSVVAGTEHFAKGPGLESVLQFCLTPAETRQLAENPDFRHLIA